MFWLSKHKHICIRSRCVSKTLALARSNIGTFTKDFTKGDLAKSKLIK